MTGATTVLLAVLALAPPRELVRPVDPIEIYGGQLAQTCQWPSTVAIHGVDGLCTASLVHPEILVTAAHCLELGNMDVGVPIVPIAMGCETDGLVPGATAVLAGYGLADDEDSAGRKRFVTTEIDYFEDTRVFFVGACSRPRAAVRSAAAGPSRSSCCSLGGERRTGFALVLVVLAALRRRVIPA